MEQPADLTSIIIHHLCRCPASHTSKIEQGVFFFPQDPSKMKKGDSETMVLKATKTGRVSHRWDSMLAQGAPEPVLAAAADRHPSTIIVKHDLGP